LNIWDKLDYYETNSQGLIVNPYVNEASKKVKTFENLEEYLSWKEAVKRDIKEKIIMKLTPLEFNIMINKSTEAPFTGLYANHYDVGMYSCKVCTQKLFSSTHKVKSDSGWALFWNYIPFSITLKTDFLDKFEFEKRTGKFPLQHDNLTTPEKRLCCSNVSLEKI
jgi:peptide methionine sulfoxide reductase MsrB